MNKMRCSVRCSECCSECCSVCGVVCVVVCVVAWLQSVSLSVLGIAPMGMHIYILS